MMEMLEEMDVIVWFMCLEKTWNRVVYWWLC